MIMTVVLGGMKSQIDELVAFQHDVAACFGSSVHHPSSLVDGSFFLLASFRCYTFRLTEESVGLALQSCLGGSAPGFHVSYQSQNHFRFSVANKNVGMLVYKIRRFIGASFDVYFHLWNNGVPHWEREKILWEEEEGFFGGPTSRLNHGEFHLWREMRKFPRNGPHRKLKRRG